MAIDLQAHGHTRDIDRPLTFEQDADDVAALLPQLQITWPDADGPVQRLVTTLIADFLAS